MDHVDAAAIVRDCRSSCSSIIVVVIAICHFPRTYCCFVAAGTCLLSSLLLNCTNTVLLRVSVAVAVAIIVPYTAVSIRFNSMHSNFIDPLLVAVIK